MPSDLSNIKPKEISFVDKPANDKEFLFFKSKKGGKMPENVGGINLNDVPVPVLKKLIEEMKPSVEKLVLLTTNLETLQNDGGSEDNSSNDVSKEFASIKKSLDELVEKCSDIEKNDKENNMPDKDNKEIPEAFTKAMEEFNKKIDGLGEKIIKMEGDVEKKNKEEKDAADKAKADADVKKNKDKKDDKDKDKDKDSKDVDVDSIVEKVVSKVESVVLEKVEKALDKRAENLVGLFSESAKEQFKPLFEGVAENKSEMQKFKKALSGGEVEEDEDGEEYVRNYGETEREEVANVEHKDNPFHGMWGHINAKG